MPNAKSHAWWLGSGVEQDHPSSSVYALEMGATNTQNDIP